MSPTVTTGADGPGSGNDGAGRPRFGELASHALRYWERRRLRYNAAYPVDLFVQSSGQRAGWVRPAIWVTGTAFAVVIAHFIMGSILVRPAAG